ncbi:hypothetical protein LXL04_019119 [Taraxacum kok-saghyz]
MGSLSQFSTIFSFTIQLHASNIRITSCWDVKTIEQSLLLTPLGVVWSLTPFGQGMESYSFWSRGGVLLLSWSRGGVLLFFWSRHECLTPFVLYMKRLMPFGG